MIKVPTPRSSLPGIADQAIDLPAALLAAVGCRLHPLAHEIDADAADAKVCQWMRLYAAATAIARQADITASAVSPADSGLVAVAMDGKVV